MQEELRKRGVEAPDAPVEPRQTDTVAFEAFRRYGAVCDSARCADIDDDLKAEQIRRATVAFEPYCVQYELEMSQHWSNMKRYHTEEVPAFYEAIKALYG